MRKSTWLFLFVTLVALGFGIRKARAQAYESQPFTAIETTVNRTIELKVPSIETGVLAVSDGGKIIARLHPSEFANSPNVMNRWVLNGRERTNVFIDDGAKMIVTYPYREHFSNSKTGDHCDGTPDGQVEGFDVNLKQIPWNTGNSNSNRVTQTLWIAPKLGCFVIREERSEVDKDGKFVRLTVHTLTHIEIGEPDPSYFDTSLPEGYAETKPEDYKGALVNHKKAQQQQQQQ